jgi:hypothetical protein
MIYGYLELIATLLRVNREIRNPHSSAHSAEKKSHEVS